MTAVGLLGILIGSFLNVVIFRVPALKSIVSPPSACGECGHAIRGYDNVPVLSWLALRGKCRDCASPISKRYPLVELGTGIFFALVAAWVLTVSPAPAIDSRVIPTVLVTVAFLYFAAISVALAMIDLDTHRLPNAIVLPAYVVGGTLLAAASVLSGDYRALLGAGIGGVALYLGYALMAFAYPGGMGFGDVKLAGVIGLYLGYLGWGQLIIGAFAAFVLGGVYSIGLLVFRRAGKKTGIPFGPWMLGGAWIAILVGPQIAAAYIALFNLGEL